MGRLGFEPRTNRLKAECSTAELATRKSWPDKLLLQEPLALLDSVPRHG